MKGARKSSQTFKFGSGSTEKRKTMQTKGQGAHVGLKANVAVLEAIPGQSLAGLSTETDKSLRQWALRVDHTYGEDGYHNALCQLLSATYPVHNLIGLIKVRTRSEIFKIHRHEQAEYRTLEACYRDKPSTSDNLRPPVFQAMCRRGHPFTPENTYTYKGRRTCQQCRRLREKGHLITT